MKVNKLIYEIRKMYGLTQKELGELIHIDSKTISSYEKGRVVPTLDILQRISEAFNILLTIDNKNIFIQKIESTIYTNRCKILMNKEQEIIHFFRIEDQKGNILIQNQKVYEAIKEYKISQIPEKIEFDLSPLIEKSNNSDKIILCYMSCENVDCQNDIDDRFRDKHMLFYFFDYVVKKNSPFF